MEPHSFSFYVFDYTPDYTLARSYDDGEAFPTSQAEIQEKQKQAGTRSLDHVKSITTAISNNVTSD
jgi:hypothetical protein